MDKLIYEIILGYIAFMSILGFIMMGIDKRRAIKKAWRISEKTLLMTAILGGGIGSFLGMYMFRHKTKHSIFVIILPLTLILDIIIIFKLYKMI